MWKELPRPHIIVSRHASWWTPNKDWPDAHWAELVDRLTRSSGVIEIGGPDEAPLDFSNRNYVNLVGSTSVEEMVAAISAADLHVGPTSAPVHIAAAARKPSVVICGGYEHPRCTLYAGNIALYTPLACAQCWLRDPCPYNRKCLEEISPELVEAAVRRTWSRASDNGVAPAHGLLIEENGPILKAGRGLARPIATDAGTDCAPERVIQNAIESPASSDSSSALPIHVINLDRTPARFAEFHRRNVHLSHVERFRAIDGRTLDREKLISEGVMTEDCIYTAGNLGCAMSHFALWRKVVEERQAITVAEDDAIFSRNFAARSKEFLQRLPEDWDFVQWGWVFQQRVWVHAIPQILNATMIFDQDQLRRHIDNFQSSDVAPAPIRLRHSFGTVCYSVSPKGASALLRVLHAFEREADRISRIWRDNRKQRCRLYDEWCLSIPQSLHIDAAVSCHGTSRRGNDDAGRWGGPVPL